MCSDLLLLFRAGYKICSALGSNFVLCSEIQWLMQWMFLPTHFDCNGPIIFPSILLEYGVKDGEFKASKMFADSEQLQNLDRLNNNWNNGFMCVNAISNLYSAYLHGLYRWKKIPLYPCAQKITDGMQIQVINIQYFQTWDNTWCYSREQLR